MSLKIISPGTVYLGSAEGGSGGGGGASLYDIKTLANSIAEKGWAFQGYSTRQDLSKEFVPKVYNDIKMKYDNCDSAPSSDYTSLLNGNFLRYTLCIDDTYIYATNTDQNQQPTYLKRTLKSAFPTTNWENTNIDITRLNGYKAIEVGDNLIIFQAKRQNQTNKIYVYKKSDLSFIKSIDIKDSYDRNNAVIHLIKLNGIKTFFLSYKTTNDNYVLSKMEDNVSANEIIIRNDLGGNIGLPAYDESTSTFWFWYARYICKSTNNFQTIENVRVSSYLYDMDYFPSVYKKDNVIMYTSMDRVYTGSCYSEDGGNTWNDVKNNVGNNIKVGCLPYFDGEKMYAQVWDNTVNTLVYTSVDLKTFTAFMTTQQLGAGLVKIIYEPTKDTLFCQDEGNVIYLGIIKTVYTDTYTIGGSSISIDYYKYGSFKICVKDSGTNDANIDTVYNALGYENYFVIDDTHETVALPRNSNLWSFMYVGDNYISENIPDGNSTRLLPQANLITDMISTSITFDSTNKVQLNTDYEYGELTALTLGSSSIIDSKLGTTIKFQSGTTATIITDSSNIQWVDGAKPEPSASKTCLIFIWDNTGFYKEW